MTTTAPSSPVYTRRSAPPVTPQRLTARHAKHLSYLACTPSPLTSASNVSTPYTPISLRSFSTNSNPNSNLTTPASAVSLDKKRILTASLSAGLRDKSLADVAPNWRSRASENGIKVSNAKSQNFGGNRHEDAQYAADDEASERTFSNRASPAPTNAPEEALLPPPFFSNHRRARAHSTAALPPRSAPSLSLLGPTTPARRILAENINLSLTLNTPPQVPTRAKKLSLKGSLTDPAQTRRRPSFGQMTTELFDIDENEYTPYPPIFSSSPMMTLNDPFAPDFTLPPFPQLTPITEDEFHTLHRSSDSQSQPFSQLQYNPSHVLFNNSPPYVSVPLEQPKIHPPQDSNLNVCSVCALSPRSLAILSPCGHPLCSACLTGALNIVGEKDMACAVCNTSVVDFNLKTVEQLAKKEREAQPKEEMNPFLLPSAFDNESEINRGNSPQFADDGCEREDSVVLRIDNVPWDITPPAIRNFLRQPAARAHVLLDRRGKTLSHAFAEVQGEEAARAALRGAQNGVLGRGKRARGVTVTRASQGELMRSIFPSWRGSFDGCSPSLDGLDNASVAATLETGLLSDAELDGLLHLVRSPDSHFLKVPELPFYALISILNKFPADVDSRVFWSASSRDKLFDVSFASIQVLLSRIHSDTYTTVDPNLLSELIHAAICCQVFTSQQVAKLSGLLTPSESPVGALAREFGVETGLVEQLAQRLQVMC